MFGVQEVYHGKGLSIYSGLPLGTIRNINQVDRLQLICQFVDDVASLVKHTDFMTRQDSTPNSSKKIDDVTTSFYFGLRGTTSLRKLHKYATLAMSSVMF